MIVSIFVKVANVLKLLYLFRGDTVISLELYAAKAQTGHKKRQ